MRTMQILQRQLAKRTAWIGIVSGIACLLASPLFADEQPDPEVQQKANGVLRTMLKERENFRSGVAEISGTKLVQFTGRPEVKGPIVGLYAFKLQGDQLRFDVEEPHLSDGVKPASIRRRFCYLRNREYSASWKLDDHPVNLSSIYIDAPDSYKRSTTWAFHSGGHLINALQTAGLVEYTSFEWGRSVKDALEAIYPDEVNRVIQDDRQTVLEWRLGDDGESGTRRLVIETQGGYRPIELTMTSKRNPAKSVTKVKWQRLGGTDVPVEITIDWDYTDPNSKRHSHYTLKYDWKKSVNKPVNPEHFDFHSFRNIPGDQNIKVVDVRGEPSSLSGDWKGNGVVERPAKP